MLRGSCCSYQDEGGLALDSSKSGLTDACAYDMLAEHSHAAPAVRTPEVTVRAVCGVEIPRSACTVQTSLEALLERWCIFQQSTGLGQPLGQRGAKVVIRLCKDVKIAPATVCCLLGSLQPFFPQT